MRTKRTVVAARRRYLKTEFSHCPYCGSRLKRAPHLAWRKKIQFLDQVEDIGCVLYRCPNPECPQPKARFTSAEAEGLSLPYGIFGLDVLAHVGWLRDFQHATLDETWADLHSRFPIGRSTVANLYQDYLAVRAAADRLDDEALVAAAQADDGLILALDGVAAKAGQAHFWVLRTANGRLILSGQWLTKVDEPSLTAWLRPIAARLKRLGIKVLATVSDHQEALVNALEAVWPDIPHQWCQSHFLRDSAEGMDKADSAFATELRQQVRAADLPLPVPPQPEAFSPSAAAADTCLRR